MIRWAEGLPPYLRIFVRLFTNAICARKSCASRPDDASVPSVPTFALFDCGRDFASIDRIDYAATKV